MVSFLTDSSHNIRSYEKNGFEPVEDGEKPLHRYWDIPERQVEESVVLAREK